MSFDYVNGWKLLLGRKVGDGVTGLLGMTASLLTLVQGARKSAQEIAEIEY